MNSDVRDGTILNEGENCWRIEHARRASFLIDAAVYFESLVSTIDQAERSIYIAAWDIDRRTDLLRNNNKSLRLGEFLNEKVARTRGLHAYILCWDFAMIYLLEREWLPLFRLEWKTHRRTHFQMAGEHPIGATLHQKFVVIDNSVAFCGGIDLTRNRWDTPEHRIDDRRRRDPHGNPYNPFHDVQMVVDGDAAAALGDLFRDHWSWNTGKKLPQVSHGGRTPWPQNMEASLTDVRVALARTLPAYKNRKEIREVEALYRDAIRRAKHSIYIENQYLTSATIADLFVESLKREEGPEIVIVLPQKSIGWLEQSTMDSLRTRVLKRLLKEDRYNRLRVFYPSLGNNESVYVHAKVMVVDDRFALVGSANLSNRSMGLDSECDLAVEVREDTPVATGIASFRNNLLAEHLGTLPEKVEKAVRESKSIIKTIQLLSRDTRTLKPLDPVQDMPIDAAALIPDASLLDPERPISLDRIIDEFVYENDDRSKKLHFIKIAAIVLALSCLVAAWRWSPLSEWISMERMITWASLLKDYPFSLLWVVGAFILGGVVMIPVTLLVIVTGIVFDPFISAFYALTGCVASALVNYFLGARLGRKTISRVAGRRLKRLNRHLAKQGLLAVALVRNLPVAPFSIVNLVAGASHIKLKDYLLGTILGMFPGVLAITIFADRLIQAVNKPQWANIVIALGVAFILGAGMWSIRKRSIKK